MPERLSDRDIAADLLSDAKELSSGYHMATMEAANRDLRRTFEGCHDEWVNAAKELFDYMYTKGWYQVQPASPGGGMGGGIRNI